MSQNQEMPLEPQAAASMTTCGNCQSPMPLGLRFCRNCGYRLGEGTAEYTDTVRFEDRANSPNTPAVSQYATTYGVGNAPIAPSAGDTIVHRAKKMSGMTWMFVGLLVFFLAAAVFTAVVTPIRRAVAPAISVPAPQRGYFGVNGFESVDGGGVTFDNVEPPNGPADRAGLLGGDIIKKFDGKDVESHDHMIGLLRETPIGKTVDIEYLRDGETHSTKITPITREESERMEREFSRRPEGLGRFGFDDDETERVPIEGTKMFGIKLHSLARSMPADMAGIKEGDVIIEFDNAAIRTPQELTSRVKRALPYTTVKVVLMRGTERLEIPVKMGRQ